MHDFFSSYGVHLYCFFQVDIDRIQWLNIYFLHTHTFYFLKKHFKLTVFFPFWYFLFLFSVDIEYSFDLSINLIYFFLQH